MAKYETVTSFCSAETSSETITNIIGDYQAKGYTYCSNYNEYDELGWYCFIYIIFKKDDVEHTLVA